VRRFTNSQLTDGDRTITLWQPEHTAEKTGRAPFADLSEWYSNRCGLLGTILVGPIAREAEPALQAL
jgi:hypothetical protein